MQTLALSTGVYSRILASLKLCVVLSLSLSPDARAVRGPLWPRPMPVSVVQAGRQAVAVVRAYGRTVTSTSAEAVVMSLIWGAFLAAAASVGGPLQQPAAQQSVVLVNQA